MRFLDRLAVHGNARAACRAVGFSPERAYRQHRLDPLFARGWALAVMQGRENSIQVLAERALEGVEEEVWYRGELVGTRRRYDNRLLLAHLARLDRLADEAAEDDGDLEEVFACIAGELPPGAEPDLPCPDFETYAEMQVDAVVRALDEAAGPRRSSSRAHLRQCHEAASRAHADASRHWAEWRARAQARIDAMIGRDAGPPAPGLPGNALPPRARAALSALPAFRAPSPSETGAGTGIAGACAFPLRTVSYASTSAIAHALSGRGAAASPPG